MILGKLILATSLHISDAKQDGIRTVSTAYLKCGLCDMPLV